MSPRTCPSRRQKPNVRRCIAIFFVTLWGRFWVGTIVESVTGTIYSLIDDFSFSILPFALNSHENTVPFYADKRFANGRNVSGEMVKVGV